MNELALFTGIGGGLLASNLLGHRTVCAVEQNSYCIEILVQRQNERTIPIFPIWDDICTFDGRAWNGTVDLVSGGFPCQAFSSASRGRAIAEKNLWGQMFRVVREVQPKAVFAENVSRKAILEAQNDLEAIGYKCRWLKLSAKDLGADHERERFWLLAYTNNYGEFLSSQYAETPIMQELRSSVWETFPDEFRVSDGVSFRMERFKALGNAQVPLVATVAWLRLNDLVLKDF